MNDDTVEDKNEEENIIEVRDLNKTNNQIDNSWMRTNKFKLKFIP